MFLEKTMFDVICFSEHWLKDYQMLLSYDNYDVGSCFNRKSMLRGGSLMLIKKGLKFKQRHDIVGMSVEHCIELSCVELDEHVIVCVYRPPNPQNFGLFESTMEDVLSKFAGCNKSIVICGDFNINILENNSNSSRFLNLFKSFNLSNVFTEPTRVTPTSATCIDNIFCNCDYLDKAIVHYLPSDHSGQTVFFNFKAALEKTQIQFRPITLGKLTKFNSNLQNRLDVLGHNIEDANKFYDKFFSIVLNEFNTCFEKKSKNIFPKFVFSDWATTGIRISRERLYELYGLKPSTRKPLINM
ncbi:hypothetical protein PYW08_013054 [Mythimna loreyi]|uniref:Uncharacterized protein n=1 Tax=Mythimna loreyi TaxID=667449 RepID=A0ACC2PZ09_9NEOP|nr:hypothetical protein PYW08_013054 [Mythimna loreyi]